MTGECEELVGRASRGDGSAVEELLARNLPNLRAYVRFKAGRLVQARESVSDLVQSVCREVLEQLGDFEYRGEASFRSWLFKRAYHKIVDRGRFHRAARRNGAREVELPESSGQGDAELECAISLLTPSRDAMAREKLERFEAAFAELPDDHREAILMQRIAGLSYSEIAREMGRSEGAVRNLVYRGLARVSLRMQAGDERGSSG